MSNNQTPSVTPSPTPEQIAIETWQSRIKANHPYSDPQYWTTEIIAKYAMLEVDDLRKAKQKNAAEIAQLKAQLAELQPLAKFGALVIEQLHKDPDSCANSFLFGSQCELYTDHNEAIKPNIEATINKLLKD